MLDIRVAPAYIKELAVLTKVREHSMQFRLVMQANEGAMTSASTGEC